ncbi:hypothetical protein EJ110_NYTH48478 [Nymphaea thermarum]|nr:hypothetical protein EJ110_NYTH48478 [Nymphaea thermarum]
MKLHRRAFTLGMVMNPKKLVAVPSSMTICRAMLSLDCGACSSYNDSLGLEIMVHRQGLHPDGANSTVQTSKSISQPLTTLRYFPTRKNNCYSIPSDAQGARFWSGPNFTMETMTTSSPRQPSIFSSTATTGQQSLLPATVRGYSR